MKNIPETIFLNLGEFTEGEWQDVKEGDFSELRKEWEITWCEDKVHSHDIEYVRKDTIVEARWHRYDMEKPGGECSVLVIHADTSFAIRYTKKDKNGVYTIPKSERGHKPLFWMEVPQVPKELTQKPL